MPPFHGLEGDRRPLRCPGQVAVPPKHLPVRPRFPLTATRSGNDGTRIERGSWPAKKHGSGPWSCASQALPTVNPQPAIFDRSSCGSGGPDGVRSGRSRPSNRSLRGHERLNFLLTAALAPLGPFVVVYRASRHRWVAEIGLILSAALAGLLHQIPGGKLLRDAVRSKRSLPSWGK